MPIPLKSFSTRFELRLDGPIAAPDSVPESVRARLIRVVDDFRNRGLPGATSLGPALYEMLGQRPPKACGDMAMITNLLYEVEWWKVYDVCEELVKVCNLRLVWEISG